MRSTRCCLCRATGELEPAGWPLPRDEYRCTDYAGCRQRVRNIVTAHRKLAEVWFEDDPDEDPIYPKWTITEPGTFEIPDE